MRRLTEAADRCWDAVMRCNLHEFATAFRDSFEAQISMFPAMMQPGVEEYINRWRNHALAWKMLGAGGGGHLALVVDRIPEDENIIRIKIRRKE
ncbi:hypothetical protein IMSAG192_01044 [Muribaculaceae bacterium]|nr:hypothetical protein IMSAG192_01044 [Muribaculaceae bacterium]